MRACVFVLLNRVSCDRRRARDRYYCRSRYYFKILFICHHQYSSIAGAAGGTRFRRRVSSFSSRSCRNVDVCGELGREWPRPAALIPGPWTTTTTTTTHVVVYRRPTLGVNLDCDHDFQRFWRGEQHRQR